MAGALAAAGADVMLNGFGDAAAIEAQRAAMEVTHGVRAAYSAADMSKPDQIRAMVGDAEKTFGKVDILVNNAGIQTVAPVEEFPDDRWELIQAINLSSNFRSAEHTSELQSLMRISYAVFCLKK